MLVISALSLICCASSCRWHLKLMMGMMGRSYPPDLFTGLLQRSREMMTLRDQIHYKPQQGYQDYYVHAALTSGAWNWAPISSLPVYRFVSSSFSSPPSFLSED